MTEGPFKNAFDGDTEGVIRREIVTLSYEEWYVMVKEAAYRDYYESGDYHDSAIIRHRW